MGWLFLLAVTALLICLLVLRRLRADKARQQLMRQRLQSSRMYVGLQTMLRQVPMDHLERVDVRQDGVSVLLLNGQRMQYLFEEHNADPVQPEALIILTQAVAADLPAVQDADYFDLRRLEEKTPGGHTLVSYAYIMQPRRKNYLLRAMKEKARL